MRPILSSSAKYDRRRDHTSHDLMDKLELDTDHCFYLHAGQIFNQGRSSLPQNGAF